MSYRCQKCADLVDDGMAFCLKCLPMIRCPNCRQQFPWQVIFVDPDREPTEEEKEYGRSLEPKTTEEEAS